MRGATLGVLALRVLYGLALIMAPGRLARRWLGPAVDGAPARVLLRALGTREVALHGAAIAAARAGRPLRPWLLASIAGDLGDLSATAAGRRGLPAGSAPATALVAGSSALLTAALALAPLNGGETTSTG